MNNLASLVHLIVSSVTFGVLAIAFFVNVSYLEEKRTWFRKFKVAGAAISILLFFVFYKEFFKYAVVFMILGILSMRKFKSNDKKTGISDSRELG